MNIYQRKLLELGEFKLDVEDAKFIIDDNFLIIEQSENAHIEVYNIKIINKAINSITIDDSSIKKVNNVFNIKLDFNNRNNKITIDFVDNLADKLILDLKYSEKSKEEWDEKEKQKRWEELIPKAQIKVSTGLDLVNIYFQPCTDDYDKTIIELYTATGKWSSGVGTHGVVFRDHVPQLLSATAENLMAKYTVEEGEYFKSITGLAYGAYGFKLSQYNSNGDLLFTTDYMYFGIRKK